MPLVEPITGSTTRGMPGCRLISAAIAFQLARGRDGPKAVAMGRSFLIGSLWKNRFLRWGPGAGPALAR